MYIYIFFYVVGWCLACCFPGDAIDTPLPLPGAGVDAAKASEALACLAKPHTGKAVSFSRRKRFLTHQIESIVQPELLIAFCSRGGSIVCMGVQKQGRTGVNHLGGLEVLLGFCSLATRHVLDERRRR